jgi:hypothetical protein
MRDSSGGQNVAAARKLNPDPNNIATMASQLAGSSDETEQPVHKAHFSHRAGLEHDSKSLIHIWTLLVANILQTV